MRATIEISMYSLSDGYEKEVIDFIQRIKRNKNMRIEVNGLSTQIFGDYEELMLLLKDEMRTVFESGKAVFLLKIAANELTKEKLPAELI